MERFLADLERLRAGLDDVPTERRRVAVTVDRSARRGELLYSVHVFDADGTSRRRRSRWAFPLERDTRFDGAWYGLATVHGDLDPGAAIVVDAGGVLLWPVGPLRPVLRGVRWRGPG